MSKRWRFNTGLLNDIEVKVFVESETKQQLEIKALPEMSPVTLWECAKAYLRGRIIDFASKKKKRKEVRPIVTLENKKCELQWQHKQQQSHILKEMKVAKKSCFLENDVI